MLVEKALEDLEKRKQMILDLRKAEKTVTKLKKSFSSNHIRVNSDLSWRYAARPHFDVFVHDPRNLDDIKPIIRFLGEHGYMLEKGPLIVENNGWVIWYFGSIELVGIFNSNEENACKFKKVGTKTVPIYELDCPGLEKEGKHVS